MIILDDQQLLGILAGQESNSLFSARSNGGLSRRFSALSAAHQADVISLVDELLADIITLDSRTVVPVMSA